MLYAIIGEDVPNSQAKRAAARPAHLRRVDELIAAGKLILGGAFPAIDSIDPGPAGIFQSISDQQLSGPRTRRRPVKDRSSDGQVYESVLC